MAQEPDQDREDLHADCKRKIQALENKVVELQQELASLTEKLGLNSSNSHLPPSRDPIKSRRSRKERQAKQKKGTGKRNGKGTRKRGDQPGHKGKNRPLVPPEQVDKFVPHVPASCEGCGSSLRKKPGPDDPPPIRHQFLELPEKLLDVIEQLLHARQCESCGEVTRAELPREVPRTCTGPRLQAFS